MKRFVLFFFLLTNSFAKFTALNVTKMAVSDRLRAINSQLRPEETSSELVQSSKVPFTLLNQWHSKPGLIRLINVGAGAAGLLLAYKMQKNFTEYELVCYEK